MVKRSSSAIYGQPLYILLSEAAIKLRHPLTYAKRFNGYIATKNIILCQ